MHWDNYLFQMINNLAGRWGGLDAVGIFAAVFLLPLMVFLLIPAAFTVKRMREESWYELPLKALVAGFAAYAAKLLIAVAFGRARPFSVVEGVHQLIPMHSIYDSFPSGHASISFAIAFMIFKYDKDWGAAFLALAALVAFGRVFSGVHYPLDILAGFAVGWLASRAVNWFEHREWGKLERALRVR